MITFKINGQKYLIPSTWSDVTYSQMIAIIERPTLVDQISIFTGIDKQTLIKSEFKNVETIALTLSFLTTPPPFEAKPTMLIGPYVLPSDVTILSLGQFEDLRQLLSKGPKKIETTMDHLQMNNLYLEACAIYVNKLEYGEYLPENTYKIKEKLKQYSCMEVISTGAFFLFRPLNLSTPTKRRSPSIIQRLKKLIVGFPGYRRTLDRLLPSTKRARG